MTPANDDCPYGSATTLHAYVQSQDDCPYGAEACPKIGALEKAIQDLTVSVRRINYLTAFIAGIIAVECGIVIM